MIYAGILAGGTGTRMGLQDLPKQFLELGEKPIVIHTIEKFLLVTEIREIYIGVHPNWIVYMEDLISKYLKNFQDRIFISSGGEDRNKTIENIILGIQNSRGLSDEDIIITHDSVRPFVSLKIIEDNLKLISNCDSVDTVVEATDTIVESLDGVLINNIPERKFLYQGQTPQTFRALEFVSLYNNLSADEKTKLTDACKIFVANGKNVMLVSGEYSNIKITTITDLKIAKTMIEEN